MGQVQHAARIPRQSLSLVQAQRIRSRRPALRPSLVGLRRVSGARAGERRWLFWMVELWMMGLLALVAPAPRFPLERLTGQSMQLAMRGMSMAARLIVKIPDTISLLVDPHAPHQYWQVGVMADESGAHASGMRTGIVTQLSQRVGDTTTNYFWVGSYLSDGSFIQIGYWVPWYDSGHAGWFYCAFDSNWHKGPCIYGALGTVGADGSSHTYTLETDAGVAAAGDKATWHALVDGQRVGDFQWTAGDTGTNAPAIYAESSGFAPHASASQLGPVDFTGSIETRRVGQENYRRAAHVAAAYSAANVCPPYGIAPDGGSGVLLGSGLACPDRFSEL